MGKSTSHPSSETQGQLVGVKGFSRAKVYNKNGRTPGHLLLPNEFKVEIPLADWSEKFSGQSEGEISNASGTRSVRVNAQGLSRSCCKLSPVKIPSPQLAAPGSPRMRPTFLFSVYSGSQIFPRVSPVVFTVSGFALKKML